MRYREFYPRTDTDGHSICLSCFRSVKATRWETLPQAEDVHRQHCPNQMQLSRRLQALWAESATEQILDTLTQAPLPATGNPLNRPPDVRSSSGSSHPSRTDSISPPSTRIHPTNPAPGFVGTRASAGED